MVEQLIFKNHHTKAERRSGALKVLISEDHSITKGYEIFKKNTVS